MTEVSVSRMAELAMTDVRGYYAEKLKCGGEWDVLDQGPIMTAARHQFVIAAMVESQSKVVLDYGCGNGQILLHDHFPAAQLAAYHGMDVMPHREEVFMGRLSGLLVPGSFHLVPEQERDYIAGMFVAADELGADTVVLCGVLGYEGFTSLEALLEAKHESNVRTLIFTVPTLTELYREEIICRFDDSKFPPEMSATWLATGLYGAVA